MRRPAPPSIEQERKIYPFLKIPVMFMFHATYGNLLASILDQEIKTGASSTSRKRIHVCLHRRHHCQRWTIRGSADSCATGRDALVTLAFTKNNPYSFRLSEERTVLTEHTINTSDIIAAFDAEGQILQFNYRILRKNFSKGDKEMYETKVTEFADHFFTHVNANKTNKNLSEKESSIKMEPTEGKPSSRRSHPSKWNLRKENRQAEGHPGSTIWKTPRFI